MKALLIADDENAVTKISSILKNEGYDVITYHWFLKALDNVEEIAPELIVMSADSYPRHWKTLVQYARSGISSVIPKVVLYSQHELDKEDLEKSKALEISGIFNSIDDAGLDELAFILSGKSKHYSMILTNPCNGLFVTGKVSKFENGLINFIPDNPKNTTGITEGLNIKQITIKKNKDVSFIKAKVLDSGNSSISLQVI